MASPPASSELRNDKELSRFVLKGKLTGKQLGDGVYGSVEEVEIRGRIYAGKRIDEHLIDVNRETVEDVGKKLAQECQLMSKLRHRHLSAFLGVCFIPKYTLPILVSELLDGSLDDLLETIPCIPLPLKLSILEDVARGLLYLHKHHPLIVHRNLTAKNVLLTMSLEAKISDFRNYHIVNMQPDFSSASATQVYLPPDAIHDTSLSCPSIDVFSFGHLTLFTVTQEFPNDLLEVDYIDSNNQEALCRSEVERRKKYFDMFEDTIVKGVNHPLAHLAKNCLNDNPIERPTAEQIVTALEDIEDEIDGAYGEFSKLDAVRQVVSMKEHFAKEFELKEKANELTRRNEKIKQLQKKIETSQQMTKEDNTVVEQKMKDEVKQKDAQIETLQETLLQLKKELLEKEKEFLHWDTERQQKESEIQQKKKELRRKEDKIKQRDGVIEEKDTQLIIMDEEVKKLQESLEEKMAELNQKDSTINHREDDVDQIGVELQQKDNQLNQKEKELHLRMEEIQLKENSLQKKDTELGSMVEQVGQLKAEIERLKTELQGRDTKVQECQKENEQLLETIRQEEIDVENKHTEVQEKKHELEQTLNALKHGEENLQKKCEELERKEGELRQKDVQLESKEKQLQQKHVEIESKDRELQQKDVEIESKDRELRQKDVEIESKDRELQQKDVEIESKEKQLQQKDVEIKSKDRELQQKDVAIESKERELQQRYVEIESKERELQQKNLEIERKEKQLQQKDVEIESKEREIEVKTGELQQQNDKVHEKADVLQHENEQLHHQVKDYEKKLAELNKRLQEKDNVLTQLTDELHDKEAQVEKNNKVIKETVEELQSKKDELQQLTNELQEKNKEIQQLKDHIKEIMSELTAIQEQMQEEAEVHKEETKTKDSQISTIMQHIYELQEAQEGLRTGLDQRNADVSRLQEELEQIKDRPYVSAVTHPRDLLNIELPLKLHWRRGKDIPDGHGMRFHPQAIVIGGKVYLGGGKSESSKQVMVYEPKHEVWATLPHYQYELFAMTVIEDQLVVVGGEEHRSRKKTNVLGVWDDALCYWTHPLPPMQTACSSPSVVNYHDKWLVAAGGSGDGGADLFTVEVMDICNDQWYSAPPLPIPASRMSATIIDSTMFVLGGCSGYYFFKNVFKVDIIELVSQAIRQEVTPDKKTCGVPAQTPWQKLPDTPFSQSTAVTLNGALLAVGGHDCSAIHLYHPESRSWVKAGDMPTERVQCASTVLPHGEVLLAGGTDTEEMMETWTVM